MKHLFSLFIFSTLISLSNCHNKKEITFNKKTNRVPFLEKVTEQYDEMTKFFNDSLISHFPDNIDNDCYLIGGNTISSGVVEFGFETSMFLGIRYENNSYDSLIDILSTRSIENYKSSDTCLLVVNRYSNGSLNKDFKIDSIKLNRECLRSKLPIPNFWRCVDSVFNTDCRLSENYYIYILGTQSGKLLPDSFLLKASYMPQEWEHGYSRGIATNKLLRNIIYWIIIW